MRGWSGLWEDLGSSVGKTNSDKELKETKVMLLQKVDGLCFE